MARLSLSFLGPFQAALDGHILTGFESNKVRALLGFLAVESERPHARESLAALLWPNYSDRSAVNNLRSVLSNLREVLDDRVTNPPYLIITRNAIQFNPAADYCLDAALFEETDTRTIEQLEALMTTYRGDFMEGFYLPENKPFEEWLRAHRDHYQRLALAGLCRLAQWYEENSEISRALHYARKQLEMDQWDEASHRRLMRLLVASGRSDLAVAQFETCRRLLQDELGIQPGEETVTLYEMILNERPLRSVPEQPLAGEPPFKGLSYFDEADAALFHGRETLTAHLLSRVRDCLSMENDRPRVITVIGASGSGKSSIVRAGLIPTVRELSVATGDGMTHTFGDAILVLTPTASPLEGLADGLRRIAGSVLPVTALVEDLAGDRQTLHLAALRIINRGDTGSHLLLIIDQFEELFSLCRDIGARRAFIDNLIYAATVPGPIVVVFALRADFYSHCAPFENLRRALTERQIYIGAMNPEELRRAIEEPAYRCGWSFEPGLVDLLLNEVGHSPGALPLLSHALLETWQRREGRNLTLAGYESSGGVAGALAQSAETIFVRFSPQEQQVARNIFLRLIDLSDIGEEGLPEFYTRRRAALAELLRRPGDADLVQGVLNRLSGARLITIGHNTVEVAHEALIREWPRLRGWLDENRDGVRLHHRLAEAAREWENSGGDEGLLYRRIRLAQAHEWAKTHQDDLNELEHRFLEAGSADEAKRQQREIATAHQLLETEQQRAAEQIRAAAHFRRLSAVLVGALVVATFLIVVAVVLGQQSERSASLAAESEARALASAGLANAREVEALASASLAVARELSFAAVTTLETDPELSLLLALQSLEQVETKEAQEALHKSIQAARTRLAIDTGATGYYGALLAITPDGSRFATPSETAVTIWDAATGVALRELPLPEPGKGHHIITFDSSGNNLALVTATPSRDSVTVYRWALAGEGDHAIVELPVAHDESSDFALTPDWSILAVGLANGVTELWDLSDGTRLASLEGDDALIVDVVFNHEGRLLATADSNRQIRIWDVATIRSDGRPKPVASWQTASPAAETGDLVNIRFSANNLLVLGYLGVVEVWDLADLGRPASIFSATATLSRDYAIDASSTRLAIAGQDSTGQIWNLNTGAQTLVLGRHLLPVDAIDFSPNGNWVFTIDRGGEVRVWDARPQPLGEKASLSVDPGAFDLDLSPDERLMALGNVGGAASLWAIDTGDRLFSFPATDGGVYRVSFSPDGRRVAAAGKDNTVRVWDTTTGEELLAFLAHGDGMTANLFQGVLDVTFSPDGTRLATVGADGLAKVWEADTGRELFTLVGHTDSLNSLTYSPDGRFIATSSDANDTTVKVWNAQTGVEVYTLAGHVARVWGLAFSPDSRTLVTGGARGIIKAWDMATGRELYTVVDNSDHIGSIAFSPDGQYFITTGEVPLRVRRAADGEEVLTLADPILWSAKVSQDGRWIYAAGVDGLVRVFALHLDDAVELSYERLTRWWRPEECRLYLHTEDCPPPPVEFAD